MDDHASAERRLEYYASKLKEAEANAASATDDRVRQTWLDVAQSWHHLADRVRKDLRLTE